MNLVANDENIMLTADIPYACQLFFRPYASCRIMRIAKQEDFDGRVSTLLLERIPIHFIASIHYTEWAFCEHAIVVPDAGEEAVIDRCLYKNFVAWTGSRLDDGGDSWHNPAGVDEGRPLDAPSVSTLKPIDGSIVVAFRHVGVTETAMLHPFHQGLLNAGCCLEIHVSHPHGDDIRVFYLVPLYAVGTSSIDDFVKVVCHTVLFLDD